MAVNSLTVLPAETFLVSHNLPKIINITSRNQRSQSLSIPKSLNDLIPQIAEMLGHIDDHPNIDVSGTNHPDPDRNRALSSKIVATGSSTAEMHKHLKESLATLFY